MDKPYMSTIINLIEMINILQLEDEYVPETVPPEAGWAYVSLSAST